ncbi:SsgA family sporulation/cell division regulator [Streptomyces dangxiongensis]|uniref:SsgA family sporulation/cell division regulator n=1 Tax=Streptomyces dangxiongensis TaxID=1442032 RepID=A0A3G2JKE0_9ACTN|nr:SsgA family sporulation/cell division regulator [Streptomyces dangxiongensis]AYN42928.1 SsgA family sporulation/cell division regulator [Streptomyces dangxiongensis]
MNPFVHKTLVVQLLAHGTGRCPVLAHLSYDADDPFAVTAVFAHDGHVLASWRLDRQMLSDGLAGPVGVGDVRMRPEATGLWHELRLEFLGDVRPDGGRHHAVVFAWAPAIASFLRETYQVLPPGQERVRVDELLEEILSAAE